MRDGATFATILVWFFSPRNEVEQVLPSNNQHVTSNAELLGYHTPGNTQTAFQI